MTAMASLKIGSANDEASTPQHPGLARLQQEISTLLADKPDVVEATLCTILSGSHMLLEDVPGIGKTTFIKGLAKLLGLDMGRIQFTSDLLPADVIGVEIYNAAEHKFVFHHGPIFANILLADELNRASPRTQSALLEAMGEGHVSVDRKTYDLPKPFIVFAAQNPSDSLGTYELPESQLDRFAARVQLGYPSAEREQAIFQQATADPLAKLPENVLTAEELDQLRAQLDAVHVAERVAAYVHRVVEASRQHAKITLGVSTRAGVSWIRMAKARALLLGRDYVTPDDLQSLAKACLGHRVTPVAGIDGDQAVVALLDEVRVN